MKKILLLQIFLISSLTYSQLKVTTLEKPIEIGKVSPSGGFLAEITKHDSTYVFTYKDMNYQQLFELKYFKFKETDFEQVYKLFSEIGDAKEGETKIIDLETGDTLSLYYRKLSGKLYISIFHKNMAGVSGYVPGLTAKQLKKLFGKDN